MTADDWRTRAACRHPRPLFGEDIFWPEPGRGRAKTTRKAAAEKAAAICRTCPVLVECDQFISAQPARVRSAGGVWAGRLWIDSTTVTPEPELLARAMGLTP